MSSSCVAFFGAWVQATALCLINIHPPPLKQFLTIAKRAPYGRKEPAAESSATRKWSLLGCRVHGLGLASQEASGLRLRAWGLGLKILGLRRQAFGLRVGSGERSRPLHFLSLGLPSKEQSFMELGNFS